MSALTERYNEWKIEDLVEFDPEWVVANAHNVPDIQQHHINRAMDLIERYNDADEYVTWTEDDTLASGLHIKYGVDTDD